MNIENGIYTGANERKSLVDFELPTNMKCNNIVLFIHGYKGFKDWGCWNLVQKFFVDNGIGFCKMNLSHNGGTIDNPIDFPDLEAFGNNRYTYELEDIKAVIDWIETKINLSDYNLHLIGHSRGGGDVILSGTDSRVKSIITWASISNIESRFPTSEELELWKSKNVRFVKNGRTKQDMPHYFSFYEDWNQNKDRLNIEKYARTIAEKKKNCLHIHGDQDEAVSITDSENLARWTNGKFIIINDTGHTFDSSHPWEKEKMPSKLKQVCLLTVDFVNNCQG